MLFQSATSAGCSLLMTEHGHHHPLRAACAGSTSSLRSGVPYHPIVLGVLSGGKRLWRDACELWMFYFLDIFQVLCSVSGYMWLVLTFISLAVLNVEIKQKYKSTADIFTVTPSCRFPWVKRRWWWGFIVRRKKRKKTKVRETFLPELLYRRDSFYHYIVDPHDQRLDALLGYMGSI